VPGSVVKHRMEEKASGGSLVGAEAMLAVALRSKRRATTMIFRDYWRSCPPGASRLYGRQPKYSHGTIKGVRVTRLKTVTALFDSYKTAIKWERKNKYIQHRRFCRGYGLGQRSTRVCSAVQKFGESGLSGCLGKWPKDRS